MTKYLNGFSLQCSVEGKLTPFKLRRGDNEKTGYAYLFNNAGMFETKLLSYSGLAATLLDTYEVKACDVGGQIIGYAFDPIGKAYSEDGFMITYRNSFANSSVADIMRSVGNDAHVKYIIGDALIITEYPGFASLVTCSNNEALKAVLELNSNE